MALVLSERYPTGGCPSRQPRGRFRERFPVRFPRKRLLVPTKAKHSSQGHGAHQPGELMNTLRIRKGAFVVLSMLSCLTRHATAQEVDGKALAIQARAILEK